LTDTNANFHPQFSPTGEFLVYQKDFGSYTLIYQIPVAGGGEEPITTQEVEYAMPQWSPISNTVICMKEDSSGFCQLYKISVETGKEIALTNDSFDHTYPRFSPSGEYILYVKSHPDSAGTQICRKPVQGGEETQLTDYSTIKDDPEWSPAGDLIVYTESDTASKSNKRITVIPAFPTATDEHFGFPISNFSIAPNPFSKALCISFTSALLAQSSGLDKLNLRIYDINGRLVRTLKTKRVEGSKFSFTWNGEDDSNQKLPNGVYFCKLQVGKTRILKKVALLRVRDCMR
jgi:Tol biopolymer transport system component